MKTIVTAGLLAACVLCFSGCVSQKPLISHAHIGHCLTTWHDTPKGKGLFDVAGQELETARKEAEAALAPGLSAQQKAEHINNAAHALNPDAQPIGPGLDYGAIRALEGAVEHLEYAATSEDASTNIVSSVAGLSDIGVAVIGRMRKATELAKSAGAQDGVTLDKIAVELRSTLSAAVYGVDANANHLIELTTAEAGFAQLRGELEGMLGRESSPRYEPVPRKYVLGLVKMPNGRWGYLPWRRNAPRPTYGY